MYSASLLLWEHPKVLTQTAAVPAWRRRALSERGECRCAAREARQTSSHRTWHAAAAGGGGIGGGGAGGPASGALHAGCMRCARLLGVDGGRELLNVVDMRRGHTRAARCGHAGACKRVLQVAMLSEQLVEMRERIIAL